VTVPQMVNESGNESGYHYRPEHDDDGRLCVSHRSTKEPVPILRELLTAESAPLR